MGDGLNCTVNSTVWHRLRIRLHKFFVFSSQFSQYFPHDFIFFAFVNFIQCIWCVFGEKSSHQQCKLHCELHCMNCSVFCVYCSRIDFVHVVFAISSYFLHDFTISSHFLSIFHFLRIFFGTIYSIVVVIAPFSSYFRRDFTFFFVFSSRILLLHDTYARRTRDLRETYARPTTYFGFWGPKIKISKYLPSDAK